MPEYFLGLDLGQPGDYTALAALEATKDPHGGGRTYAVRHLQRWPLGTSFTGIATELDALLRRPPRPEPPHDAPPLSGCVLAVDGTGVGQPVLEFFRGARLPADLRGVFVTAGRQDTRDNDGFYHVPKQSLMATLQVLLESRRLQICRGIPLAAGLAKELSAFGARGHDGPDGIVRGLAASASRTTLSSRWRWPRGSRRRRRPRGRASP